MTDNILMVSADRWVVAGDKGPFHYMLESFSRHWGRVDVIGMRPERRVHDVIFDNVHLHHPETGKLRQARFIASTGRRLASERPYTVMTSHDYNPFTNGRGAWRIAKATGIPWISEIHHVPGYPRPANLRERVDTLATRRWVRWVAGRAAGIRVVNAVELPPLLQRWGVAAEAIHVLPSLYLDLDVFLPAEQPAAPSCDVLMVGRLVPNKGVLSVLEAVRRLVKRGMGGLSMRLVGRGTEAGRIEAFLARHGLTDRVEMVGWVPDADALAEVYRSARVLVCASTSEGGPRVVAEALACGTPVVSTRVGVVPELIDDGRNGIIYDGRTASLTLALQRLLTDTGWEGELRGRLPPDMSRYVRETVIAQLAEGLKSVAARARSPSSSAAPAPPTGLGP